jgi:uncharacterized heparinase superfamily protein
MHPAPGIAASPPEKLARLWRTVRWLRWEQWLGRAWVHVPRLPPRSRPPPPVAGAPAGWIACGRSPSLVGATRLRAVGVEGDLATAQDWRARDRSPLWLYNAHYFDDLVADGAEGRAAAQQALIARWIVENPRGSSPGWDPYPTSLRLVNWIKQAWRGAPMDETRRQSLADQARWLAGRLEWHLLGNHLWANAKALLFAGAFFDGAEAAAWRRAGLRLVRRELREQVLSDHGHFERSPMYHAIVLEDLLDLVQLAMQRPDVVAPGERAAWSATATGMLGWLRAMTHPDGEPAFFNDTAPGVAPSLATLEAYAAALGVAPCDPQGGALAWLRASGYVRATIGPAVLIADVGEIGPDYLPGHAHADSLSFEWSLDGHRCVVNAGISEYGAGPERLRQRATAAHSTMEIDGRDSSEVWSGFRVGRRARVHAVDAAGDAVACRIEATHDGYAWLDGCPLHRRRWTMRAGALEVDDGAGGSGHARVVRVHLHPDWSPELTGPAEGWLRGPGRPVRWRVEGAAARIEPDAWHPGFAQSRPSATLRFDGGDAAIVTRFTWEA